MTRQKYIQMTKFELVRECERLAGIETTYLNLAEQVRRCDILHDFNFSKTLHEGYQMGLEYGLKLLKSSIEEMKANRDADKLIGT